MSRSCLPAKVALPRALRAALRPGRGSSCRRARQCSASWRCRLRTNRAAAASLAVSSAVSHRGRIASHGSDAPQHPCPTCVPHHGPFSAVPRFWHAARRPSPGPGARQLVSRGCNTLMLLVGPHPIAAPCGDPPGRFSDHPVRHHLRHPSERGRFGHGPNDIGARAAQHASCLGDLAGYHAFPRTTLAPSARRADPSVRHTTTRRREASPAVARAPQPTSRPRGSSREWQAFPTPS